MSIDVKIFGADTDSDEYKAAEKLKQIIIDSVPSTACGEIVLFASATFYGQAVKDVDLLMVGDIYSGYTITSTFHTDDGIVKDQVTIKSFCTTIEVKRHDISGIFLNGTDLYVKYNNKKHCVTLQSNRQKIATKGFFEKTLTSSPYITNVIWFTQATPSEIKGLLTNNGKVMPSNALGSDFDFKELMQLVISQNPPTYRNHKYVADSYYNSGSLDAIRNVLSLFSKHKEQTGELTRRRIEQITSKSFESTSLVDTNGKVSVYRGRAGTGKTVGLIQTAIHLVDENQARVLILTYNKALVSDIRRLFALAELPDMFEENCLHINTMHAYFYKLVNLIIYNGKLSGDKFIDKYESVLKELNDYMHNEETISLVHEMCSMDSELDWDYVLIDEAQDWSNSERDVILKLFDKGKIIVADGGQQFVRRISPCDWSVIRERNNIKLKYCLRQKENLIEFINAYAKKNSILGATVLSKKNMLGGKVIITSDDKFFDIYNQEMNLLKSAGNMAYDMLLLVPHTFVKKQAGDYHFSRKEEFEKEGIFIWDGTNSKNREGYSIDTDEVRLLQYDSSRGLEGWTVVCLDFDVFLEEKGKEYVDGSVDSLLLESPEERKRKFLYNWAMIPFTRAIDTLIVTLKNPKSEVGLLLAEIAQENFDFVSWM